MTVEFIFIKLSSFSYGFPSSMVEITEALLEENPDLKKALEKFAKKLSEKQNIAGVQLHKISFTPIFSNAQIEKDLEERR